MKSNKIVTLKYSLVKRFKLVVSMSCMKNGYGIEAQSYIFYNEDIKHLGENELLEIVGKKRTTYSKESIYTFVNFDFKT